jgi:hypothetical protein
MRLCVFIFLLLATFILAPVLDVVACDDCKDIMPLHDVSQRFTNNTGSPDSSLAAQNAGEQTSPRTATAQDRCPVCSNMAAGISKLSCSAPSSMSQENHLPKLLAFLDPSYPINKPPQN